MGGECVSVERQSSALVTGAARGIGAAIVKAFIGEGARVWLTDVSFEAGRKLAAELGRNATFSHLDVREEVGHAAAALRHAGGGGFDSHIPRLRRGALHHGL